MGTAPGAGEEAIVGGEEGGKGEDMVRGSGLGREGEMEVVDVARARERGGSLRRTMSCGGMWERELRRESLGEEGSASITVKQSINFGRTLPNLRNISRYGP